MDWNAVSAISSAVGAVGVIVSLLYLAVQVRQNTKWSKAAMRQSLADGAQRLASDLVEGDDIARIMWQALEGSEIAPQDRLRLYWEAFQLIFAAPFRGEVNALLGSEQPLDLKQGLVQKAAPIAGGN